MHRGIKVTDKVLVTGFSGFIGANISRKLLDKGYNLRGAVRNLDKANKIVDALSASGCDTSNIELVEVELGSDAGWSDAVKDCRYIQHTASPLPNEPPTDREALVPEARAGAQRVLENGYSAGVEKIVMTSSIAAMTGRSHKEKVLTLNEDSWSDPEWKYMTSYPISKTRAEISAWAYTEAQGLKSKLTTICPGLVFGPDTFGNAGASLGLLKSLMIGNLAYLPKVGIPLIDVRDCASIHVSAMTSEQAGGRRLLATGETLWFKDIANILRNEFKELKKIPKSEMPNFLFKVIAMFDDRVKILVQDLGKFYDTDSIYVNNMTKVIPRPAKQAIIDGAHSLIANGSVRLK